MTVKTVKTVESYGFGYDIDAVLEVQQHVIDNYSAEHYKMHVAPGDHVMNHMTLYRGADAQLDELIAGCEGAGDFEE